MALHNALNSLGKSHWLLLYLKWRVHLKDWLNFSKPQPLLPRMSFNIISLSSGLKLQSSVVDVNRMIEIVRFYKNIR